MLFNSIAYLLFLPIVFYLYWFVFNKNLRIQNFLILICSYVFYGWWDWRFLSLIALSTIVDYLVGLKIYNTNKKKEKKFYLWISIAFNLSLLGFFKYYNFFINSWVDMVSILGYNIKNTWTLNVILPVGISFYTFQTMSYSLDIYYKKVKPTKDFISFASFVSFFPQLVAGPIERASNLLPQVLLEREFRYEQGVKGLRLILWGMFKKVVISDSLAPVVNKIFENYTEFNGLTLLLGLIYFSFQIYCDFSGYSDIAIGTARLFGFKLMSNFKLPYFSRNIGEFWRRWHISLSTWFRDYLYIPLGGSKGGKWLSIRNIFIIFLISGFWHGANWTFIMWGFLHALFYVPLFLLGKNKQFITDIIAEDKLLPSFKELLQMVTTFFLTIIAWVFFRSETIVDGFSYLFHMVSADNFGFIMYGGKNKIILLIAFLILEWFGRKRENWLQFDNQTPTIIRWSLYLSISFLVASFFGQPNPFIYFQF